RIEYRIQVGKAQHFKNIEDGFVHAAHADIPAVLAYNIHKSHNHAQPGAGNVSQPMAVDDDPELIFVDQSLDCIFKMPRGMGVQISQWFYDRDILAGTNVDA